VSVYGFDPDCPLKTLNALSGFRHLASTSPSKGNFNWVEVEKLALTRKLTALGAVKCCEGVQKKESQPPIFGGLRWMETGGD
jgi:hypothetical protein